MHLRTKNVFDSSASAVLLPLLTEAIIKGIGAIVSEA